MMHSQILYNSIDPVDVSVSSIHATICYAVHAHTSVMLPSNE